MVAKIEAHGHPVYYFENTEGGHGSGSVNKQTAEVDAPSICLPVDDAEVTPVAAIRIEFGARNSNERRTP